MSYFFEDISALDGINGFEINSLMTHAYNEKFDITLVKHDGFFWAERTEEEEVYQEIDGRIYVLGTIWYMKFDYVKWENDYHNNELDPDDFWIEDYEL